jgi:hypothetical protein
VFPASPYPDWLTEDERKTKTIRMHFTKINKIISSIVEKIENQTEHTCEGLPFCSEGRFGFVKSL